MVGLIHQMHFQKCYLAAHHSGFSANVSQLCSFWGDEAETFSQTILCYPAKAAALARHLHGVSSSVHATALLSSFSRLLSLAAFIMAMSTAFPPDMPPFLPLPPTSLVFPPTPFRYLPVALLAPPPPRPVYLSFCGSSSVLFLYKQTSCFSSTEIIRSLFNSMFGDVSST